MNSYCILQHAAVHRASGNAQRIAMRRLSHPPHLECFIPGRIIRKSTIGAGLSTERPPDIPLVSPISSDTLANLEYLGYLGKLRSRGGHV